MSFSCVLDDHSLVELNLITSDEDSSYINASFIKVDGEETTTLHVFLST